MNNQHTTLKAIKAKQNRPDWVLKVPVQRGEQTRLERIGVAWNRSDGGLTIRRSGEPDIYLYPNIPAPTMTS